MRAGDLKRRVTIQRQQMATGEWGREAQWAGLAQAWASVRAAAGTERFDAKTSGTNAATRYVVTIRYRDDVTAADRIVDKGQVLDITSVVDPDGRRRELRIECVANGETQD